MENVLISNPDLLEQKIARFKESGAGSVHILSDFDRSFTKCFVDGKKSSTSWAQFRNLGLLDEDYTKRAHEMFDYYRPFEISTSVSEAEKQEKMKEWWGKHLDLLIEKGVSHDLIQRVVNSGGIVLREGAKEVLGFLKEKGVPLVFISSGLGDLIKGVLEKEGVLSDSVYIVSNFFSFDDEGVALSFNKDTTINSQNKNESALSQLDFFDQIKDRKNVILVGDALEDLRILDGSGHDEAITIGFFNEEEEGDLELFKKSFDIVILGDGGLDFLLELLNKINSNG